MKESKPYYSDIEGLKKRLFRILLIRLIIPVLFLMILGTIAVGYLGYKNIEDLQRQRILAITQVTDRYLDQSIKAIDAVSAIVDIAEDSKKKEMLSEVWGAYKYFETLYYLNDEYQIQYIAPENIQILGLDMSNVPDIEKSEREQPVVVSRPFISLRTGDPTVVMVKALPKRGYVVGELNLNVLQNEIQNQKSLLPQGVIYIMDSNGNLLGHPERQLVKEQTNYSNTQIYKKGLQEDQTFFYWEKGQLFINSTSRTAQTNWIVVDQIPLKTVFLPYLVGVLLTSGFLTFLLLSVFKYLRENISGTVVVPLYSQVASESANRLQAEALATESERRFKAIFNQAYQFIGLLDLEGKVIEFNQMGKEISGYGNEVPSEVLFWETPCWKGNEETSMKIKESFERAKTGELVQGDTKCVFPNGKEHFIDLSIKPLVDDNGDVTLLIAEGRDISKVKEAENALKEINEKLEERVRKRTHELEYLNKELAGMNLELYDSNEFLQVEMKERLEAEKQLETTNYQLQNTLEELQNTQSQMILQEKMAALGGLVAGIAHEVNTPIGVSVTSASYLEREFRDIRILFDEGKLKKQDFKEFIHIGEESIVTILNNLSRADELIGSFKNVAVNQSSDVRSMFNLKQFTDDIIISLKPKWKKARHQIKVYCPESLEMFGYPGAYSQIITNLMLNSFFHGFENREEGMIEIRIEQGPGGIYMKYHDNGTGIDMDIINDIFSPFFTTKRAQGGTGLGLYIVYNLITQKFGGTIACNSKRGDGVEFRVFFPRVTIKND